MPVTGCLCWLYGVDGACIVELRVNDTERMVFSVEGGGVTCGLTEDECKQKHKKKQKNKGCVCAV